MAQIEQIADDLRSITKDADPQIEQILKNLDDASAEAKDLVATAKSELDADRRRAARQARQARRRHRQHRVDHRRRSISDKGTLGRLVNDPAIADNVEQITDDAKGFLGTLFGLKAYVGLRSEYNVLRAARAPLRHGRAAHAARTSTI